MNWTEEKVEAVRMLCKVLTDTEHEIRRGMEAFGAAVDGHSNCTLEITYEAEDTPGFVTTTLDYAAHWPPRACVRYLAPTYRAIEWGEHTSAHGPSDLDAVFETMERAIRTEFGGMRQLDTVACHVNRYHHDYSHHDRIMLKLWERGARQKLKRELMERAWAPERHVDWCLSVDERRDLGLPTP